uniref:hypothetical protein n=1 Tax=Thauera aminoaromatica TaxID=164330 RepID=UPI0035B1C455
GATSSGATSGWHIGLVDGKPALVPDEPPRYEPPQTKVIVNAFRGVDTGNETANKIVNEHINPFLNVINPAFGGLNAVLVLDDLFRRAAPDLHAGLMTVPALAPEHGIAEAAQAVEHGIVSAARSNALRSAVQAPIFWFMTAGGVGGSVPGLATKAPKAVQEVTPLAKVSGEVAPFRMPTVRAGKELYIKNYLDLTVQKAVTEAAAMTEAAPARAALNLPPKIGFINPFQKAGYVVEYTTKARLDSGAVSGRTFRGLSLIEQLRPGKNPDVLLNEPFASMWSTVSPWDVTTAKQAVVKAANGVEWTFVVYEINWAALFKNALSQ